MLNVPATGGWIGASLWSDEEYVLTTYDAAAALTAEDARAHGRLIKRLT
jgi:hypothetical protein